MFAALAPLFAALSVVPVTCYSTQTAYINAGRLGPNAAGPNLVQGFYSIDRNFIGLSPNFCKALLLVGRTDKSESAQAVAVLELGHEIGHARGIPDETAADCYGASRFAEIAYRLGLRDRQEFAFLEDLAHWYAGYQVIPRGCFARGGFTRAYPGVVLAAP